MYLFVRLNTEHTDDALGFTMFQSDEAENKLID